MNVVHPRSRSVRAAAFTMVELALCIAIVAFAMVAILGVLPLGLSVQKQNREETIVDQEAPMWVDIIRRGGIGWDEVTNYVDYVLVERTAVNSGGGTRVFGFRGPFYSTEFSLPAPNAILQTPGDIVSLLSIPRFEADQGVIYSNRITAVCRSFSGTFNSQIRPDRTPTFRPDERQLDDAFRYQIQVELTPASSLPALGLDAATALNSPEVRSGGFLSALRLNTNLVEALRDPFQLQNASQDLFAATLYDLRLTFRWPVFRVGNEVAVGPGQRVIRAQVFGKPRFAIVNPNNINAVYWPGTPLRPRRFDGANINRDLTR